jgi:hypothetical protein
LPGREAPGNSAGSTAVAIPRLSVRDRHVEDDDAVRDGVAVAALEFLEEAHAHVLRDVLGVGVPTQARDADREDRVVVPRQEPGDIAGLEQLGVESVFILHLL